jgi:serine protease Do
VNGQEPDRIVEPVRSSAYLSALGEDIEELLNRVRPGVVQIHGSHRVLGAGVVAGGGRAVVTAHHVVSHQRWPAEVVGPDGRRSTARLLSVDPARDLAVLQVPDTVWPPAMVGDSSRLRVGELVFALGHPWGQPWAVALGIVSALGPLRLPRRPELPECIWSDVRLAPGNSGGPLFNARGEVVGVCSMVIGGDLAVAVPSRALTRWSHGLPRCA